MLVQYSSTKEFGDYLALRLRALRVFLLSRAACLASELQFTRDMPDHGDRTRVTARAASLIPRKCIYLMLLQQI